MQHRSMCVVGVICLIALSAPVFAQEFTSQGFSGSEPAVAAAAASPAWGTSSDSVLLYNALDLDNYFATGVREGSSLDWYCTGTAGSWCGVATGVHFPSGALITGIGIDACDASNAHELRFVLFKRTTAGVIQFAVPDGFFASTGDAGTPGCTTFVYTPPSPVAVDNSNGSYLVAVFPDNSTAAIEARLGAVRLYYRLRVSPAPATATFTDVPTTHPFFQFIEALAAAGITGGCAGPPLQFCPEAPISRGQMAVFLSRALGLHFPN